MNILIKEILESVTGPGTDPASKISLLAKAVGLLAEATPTNSATFDMELFPGIYYFAGGKAKIIVLETLDKATYPINPFYPAPLKEGENVSQT